MFVTYKLINDRFPCKEQLRLFATLYPAGVELTEAAGLIAIDQGLEVTWLCVFLSKTGQQEFIDQCVARVTKFLNDDKLAEYVAAYQAYEADPTQDKKEKLKEQKAYWKAHDEVTWAQYGKLAKAAPRVARAAARAAGWSAEGDAWKDKKDKPEEENAKELAKEYKAQVKDLVKLFNKL